MSEKGSDFMNKLIYLVDWFHSRGQFICPSSFDEIERIAHILLHQKSVSVDLSRLNSEDKMRVLYFLSGISYAINGTIAQISATKYKFSASDDTHLKEINQN